MKATATPKKSSAPKVPKLTLYGRAAVATSSLGIDPRLPDQKPSAAEKLRTIGIAGTPPSAVSDGLAAVQTGKHPTIKQILWGSEKPSSSNASVTPNTSTASNGSSTGTGDGTSTGVVPPSFGPAPGLVSGTVYKPVVIPSFDPYPGQTAAQVASSEIKPQLQAVAQTSAAEKNMIQGMAQAIISQLGSLPKQVSTDYNQAQGTIQGLAQTAGNELAAQNPNDQTQAMLNAIGAPQSQKDQVAAQNAASYGGGGALQFVTSGAIPSASLALEKAAALQYAQTLPQIQGLAATQALRNLLYQNAQQKAAIAAQEPTLQNQASAAKASALAQRVGDLISQHQAIASNAAQINATNQNAWALGGKNTQTSFTDSLAMSKADTDASYKSSQLGIAAKKLNLAAQSFQAKQQAAQQALLTKGAQLLITWMSGSPKLVKQKDGSYISQPVNQPFTPTQSIAGLVNIGIPLSLAKQMVANAYNGGS